MLARYTRRVVRTYVLYTIGIPCWILGGGVYRIFVPGVCERKAYHPGTHLIQSLYRLW